MWENPHVCAEISVVPIGKSEMARKLDTKFRTAKPEWAMQNYDDAKTLRWVEGFKDLQSKEIRSISSMCRWRWYRPNQRIFLQNDPSHNVFFIVQGAVRITSYSIMGKEVSFRDLRTGECFGDLAAVDGLPRSATAIAVSHAYLASMSADNYWQVVMTHPTIAAACLKRIAGLVRALSDRVIEYSLLPVRARIALELLRLAQRQLQGNRSAKIDPAPTHAEIASRVATHREAVTRELRHLASRGIIVRKGRKIVIADVSALRAILSSYEEKDTLPMQKVPMSAAWSYRHVARRSDILPANGMVNPLETPEIDVDRLALTRRCF